MAQSSIHSVQMVLRENIYGFQGNQKSPYLKVTVTDPRYIGRVRKLIEKNDANFKGLWRVAGDDEIVTFDNIPYLLRFMIDIGVGIYLTHL